MSTPHLARVLEHLAAKLRAIDIDEFFPLVLILPVMLLGVPMFFYAAFVIGHHAAAYIDAGVPHDEAYPGAVTSQVLAIAALTAVVAVAHRGMRGSWPGSAAASPRCSRSCHTSSRASRR